MSFWRLYYHLTWSTKHRQPFITQAVEPRLFDYILLKSAEAGAYIYALNGWTDHIHLVAAIPPEIAVSNYVKLIKGASSHYVNQNIRPEQPFAWQRGYGALSLGERQREAAIDYVNNQKNHHLEESSIEWLERVNEILEGPQHPKLLSGQGSKSIYEIRQEYVVEAGIPF